MEDHACFLCDALFVDSESLISHQEEYHEKDGENKFDVESKEL